MEKMLANLDQFRVVSKDLTRGGITGGAFTAIAYALLVMLLIAELGAFLRVSYVTDVYMDENDEKLMPLNFDITLFDLPCKYLKIAVFDKFGDEKINAKQQFNYQPLDHTGEFSGKAYTSDEVQLLEAADAEGDTSDEDKKELDSDWSSTSDHFKHQDFHKAVTFHDYTLVNFYADWCIHCRQFYPQWTDISSKLSEKTTFTDAEGRKLTVKFMRINCVDFGQHCQAAQIAAFPSIRLYKSDGTFETFKAKRNHENIVEFLTKSIKNSHLIVAQHHSMFSEGCQVQGKVEVPRVPGHFYLQAEAHGEENVNPALTNVSHLVNHFSFGDKESRKWAERQNIPKDLVAHITPLDGQSFIANHFHEAPQHYLKVVSTAVEGRSDFFYQITHSDRVRKLKNKMADKAPQARFTYDFSPMSVIVKAKRKRWYEFVTSLFAILGGTYTVVELFSGAVDTVHSTIKESMGKSS